MIPELENCNKKMMDMIEKEVVGKIKMIEELKKKMDKDVIRKNNFIQLREVEPWYRQQGEKMGGLLDVGTPLALAGEDWVKDYMGENSLEWDDMKVGKSDETFQFGHGRVWPTTRTLLLPVSITDKQGNMTKIKMNVHLVEARVPLLIGKDAHVELNIVTLPKDSTCYVGVEDEEELAKLIYNRSNEDRYDLKETRGGHWKLEFDVILVDNKEVNKTVYDINMVNNQKV